MHVRLFRSILLFLALALTLAAGGSPVHAQVTPTLTTNAQDYIPGDTVILVGSGFQAGESIDVSIAIDDDANNVHIGDYDWTIEEAGSDGGFVTFWTVPVEALGMTLRATALGLTSAAVATTSFTDDVPPPPHLVRLQIRGLEFRSDFYRVTVTSGSNSTIVIVRTNGTPCVAGSAAFSDPAPVDPLQPVTLTPTDGGDLFGQLTTGAAGYVGTYTSVINPPSGFTAGAAGDTTDVIVTYSLVSPPTNAAPAFNVHSINYGIQPGPTFTVTVTPQDFVDSPPGVSDPNGDPIASLQFSDGSTSKTLTFDPCTSSFPLTIVAQDDPSARNVNLCYPIFALSTQRSVTASASINAPASNGAPVFDSASNLDVGDQCASSVTIPICAGSFHVTAHDPEGDPFSLTLSDAQVTLSLLPAQTDATVSVPVTITATDDPSARQGTTCGVLSPMTSTTTVYVSARLHRNSAPTITAHDADLGCFVGRLVSGQFVKTVTVSPATFGASATDPEGDPVSLVASVANVTLVGPGVATATVTLTATDNPSPRTGGACAPASSTRQVQVSARIVYRFDGVLAPLSNTTSTKVKRGSNVNVKFRLYDANNVQITTMLLNPAGGPTTHTIGVAFNQCSVPDGDVIIDEPGAGDDDNISFAYVTDTWLFRLHTNTSYALNTTYIIRIHTNDGLVHHAMISIKP